MKKIAKKLRKLRSQQSTLERELCDMILDHIDNDLKIEDENIFITYLAGDVFGFMIQDHDESLPTGIGVETVIDMIEEVKPEKIKISELVSIRSL